MVREGESKKKPRCARSAPASAPPRHGSHATGALFVIAIAPTDVLTGKVYNVDDAPTVRSSVTGTTAVFASPATDLCGGWAKKDATDETDTLVAQGSRRVLLPENMCV